VDHQGGKLSEEPSIREVVDHVLSQYKNSTPMGQAVASSTIRVSDDPEAHTELLRHLLAMSEATEAVLQMLAMEIDDLKSSGSN
jgi:hypothetical protein